MCVCVCVCVCNNQPSETCSVCWITASCCVCVCATTSHLKHAVCAGSLRPVLCVFATTSFLNHAVYWTTVLDHYVQLSESCSVLDHCTGPLYWTTVLDHYVQLSVCETTNHLNCAECTGPLHHDVCVCLQPFEPCRMYWTTAP